MKIVDLFKKHWTYVLIAIVSIVALYYSLKLLPYLISLYLFERIRKLSNKVDKQTLKDPRSRK